MQAAALQLSRTLGHHSTVTRDVQSQVHSFPCVGHAVSVRLCAGRGAPLSHESCRVVTFPQNGN